MTVAYVDTSAILAVEFGEEGAQLVADRINGASALISSNLLAAEFHSAMMREGLPFNGGSISGITWINPDRSLNAEFELVLNVGYLRGADLWHVAVALFASPDPSLISFVTLDQQQRDVARALGFQT